MDFPENKREKCRFCGQMKSLVRRGDGQMFRGRPNYWYTESPPHDCPERDVIAKGLASSSEALMRAFIGPPVAP